LATDREQLATDRGQSRDSRFLCHRDIIGLYHSQNYH